MSDSESASMTSRASTPFSPTYNLLTPESTPGRDGTPGPVARLKKLNKERMPAVVKLSNSKGSEHLDKDFPNVNGMFFQSYNAVITAIGTSHWHPPAQDATIPQTDEQDRVVVRRLFKAIRDVESALDTENSPYRKRFTPGKDTCYEAWTIEACAWEILNLVKTIHTKGFNAAIFDTHILADIGQTENWTFEVRIDMICRVVRNSKNVAVTLMKREKVWTIIGAPHKLYHSNLINTVSNKDRNLDVKTGRAARKGTVAPMLKRKASAEELAMRRKAAKMVKNGAAGLEVVRTPTIVTEAPTSPAAVDETPATPTPVTEAPDTPTAVDESQTSSDAVTEASTSSASSPKVPTGPNVAPNPPNSPTAVPKTKQSPAAVPKDPNRPADSPQVPPPSTATSKVRSGLELQHAELLMGLCRK